MRLRIVAALALVVGVATACGGGGDGALDSSTAASTTATVPAGASNPASSASSVSVTAAPWQLGSPVSREVLVTDGRSLYLAGGLDAAGVSSSAVLRIDPTSGNATSVGTLELPVHDAMGIWRDGEVVVVAGGTPPIRTEVQAVTPGGSTRIVGRIPESRADHVVAEVGDTIYVLGGGDEASQLVGSVAASSDGGATWRAAGSLVEAVRYPGVAVLGGAVYLFGGVSTMQGTDTTSVQRYDPETGETAVVGRLPAPLSHATAIRLGDAVLLAGGYVDDHLGAQIWRFDPTTATTVDSGVVLPAPSSDSAAAVVDGIAYLVGGQGTDKRSVSTVTLLRNRS